MLRKGKANSLDYINFYFTVFVVTKWQNVSFMFCSMRFYSCTCTAHRSTSSVSITHTLTPPGMLFYMMTQPCQISDEP